MDARELIAQLNEFIPFSDFGDFKGTTIATKFRELLPKFGYDDVDVDVVLDFEEGEGGGIIVTFFDSDGDEVSCLFYIDPEYGAVASVISEDDDQIDIHLDQFNPPIVDTGGGFWLDLSDLSWLNKSVITAILMAGDVHESLQEADGTMSQTGVPPNTPLAKVGTTKTAVLMGGKRIKLPVITKRSEQTEPYKRALQKARILGKKVEPKSFAEKVKDQYTKR